MSSMFVNLLWHLSPHPVEIAKSSYSAEKHQREMLLVHRIY